MTQQLEALGASLGALQLALSNSQDEREATERRLSILERRVHLLYIAQPIIFALGFVLGRWV